MSLQVWLPLNGSLKNQGLSTQTGNFTTTPIWATTGKIGASALYTKTRMTTVNFPGLVGVSTYSVAYWLYIPTEVSPTAWSDMFGIQFNCGGTNYWERDERRAATTTGRHNYHLAKSTTEGSNANGYYGTQEDDSANDAWIHIVMTKDNTNAKLYRNGELKVTIPSSNFENTPRTMTGAVYLGDSGCEAYLQDFRIYDHALSIKEIEELSKGLVLHYKLNGNGKGNDNILINTHFDTRYSQTSGWNTSKNGTLLATSWGGYNSGVSNQDTVYHAHLKEFNGEYVYEYIKTANESWLGISQGGLQSKIIAGQTYTFSWEEYHIDGVNRVGTGLYYYKTGASSANFHLGVQSATNITRVIGQWQKYSYTFTAPSDADYSKNMSWYIYGHYNGNGTFYMRYPKLELGDSATEWIPNLNDKIYNLYDTSIIYDSSGYERNGSIIGTLSNSNNTPKYNSCTYFNGSSDIRSAKSSFGWFDFKEGTVAAWYNPANTTQTWASVGIQNDSGQGSRSFSVCNYSGKAATVVGYDSSWGNSSSNFSMAANTWCHLCATITNGDTVKLYANGELVQTRTVTNSTGTIASTTQFAVGVDLPGSDERFTGYLSDVRCYSTALTAEQVKELYNTSAAIDKNGNLYAREVIE